MIGLIILLLIAAVAVYAVFFLIFKLIWMIIKKQGNKWPLILAGVCTVLFGGAVIGGAIWGVHKIIKPFKPITQSITANPAPIYGESVFADPQYGFELTVFDGMTFSDWINFEGASLKLGIDTNIFKKDNAGKSIQEPVTITALLRLKNDSDSTSIYALQKALEENKDRRLEVHDIQRVSVSGQPALYAFGTAYSNRGESIPVWMIAAENGKHVYYVLVTQIFKDSEVTPTQPEQILHSLRFTQSR